jgi:hypothetical protein
MALGRVLHAIFRLTTYFPQGRLWEVYGGEGGGKLEFRNIMAILL